MAKPTNKLNTEVVKKTDEDDVVVSTVSEDVEVAVLAAQSAAAAELHQTQINAKAAIKASLNQQVNVNGLKPSVGESAELIAAVKKDAEKRGKDFSVCPISGVLVVG